VNRPRQVQILPVVHPRPPLLIPCSAARKTLIRRKRVSLPRQNRLANRVVRLGVADRGRPSRGSTSRRGLGRLADDGAGDGLAEKVGGEETVDEVGVEELVVEVFGEEGGDLRGEAGQSGQRGEYEGMRTSTEQMTAPTASRSDRVWISFPLASASRGTLNCFIFGNAGVCS
jgi:hypothetical protein